jgi:hypothetical protein
MHEATWMLLGSLLTVFLVLPIVGLILDAAGEKNVNVEKTIKTVLRFMLDPPVARRFNAWMNRED